MKKILLLVGLVVAGVWLICASAVVYDLGYLNSFTAMVSPAQPPSEIVTPAPPVPPKPLPDADPLAARSPKVEAIYQKVRDDALAAYASAHPQPKSYDGEARATLRVLAYLSVRGDFYGECLWQQVDSHAQHLIQLGCSDPIWTVAHDIYVYNDIHSADDKDAMCASDHATDFGKTAYPALLKHLAYLSVLKDFIKAKEYDNPPLTSSLDQLPKLSDAAVQNYGQMVIAHLPHEELFLKGHELLDTMQNDETALQSINDGIDKTFTANDPGNPIQGVLNAAFYVNDAWNARGTGYSNTVSAEGWRLMADRLERAENILTELYSKYPDEESISQVMMKVVLGRQESRDQMELWFQRGIKTDPDNFSLYMAKRWYLLPRWYGSDEIVWNFGLECSASDNWSAKIPLILIEAIDDAAQRDSSVYARDEIWTPVEKTFRSYLVHYPNALAYRTRFFQCAVQGGHWDVANEQLKILGGDWDRVLLQPNEFGALANQAKARAEPGK